jgi:ADP-heptose:LPS heptosyltransferase
MAMPAIQALREEYVDAHITLLTKTHLGDLWRLHTVADNIIELGPGHAGTLDAVSRVRKGAFDIAYVMPNSFRSALIPFMGGVPKRKGMSGHSRAFMLNDVVPRSDALADQHQAWEYLSIVNLSPKIVRVSPFGIWASTLTRRYELPSCQGPPMETPNVGR